MTSDRTICSTFHQGEPGSRPGSIESLVEAAVERAITRTLEPHLRRLKPCSPEVYTVSQAAEVLQVSDETIGRLVRRGVLPRVPHLDGKVLIPRQAVATLIDNQPDECPTRAPIRAASN
jgi:excisionase family DNA binding protein